MIDTDQRSNQQVSPKCQQQFQGMTVWMSHLAGRSMACLVVVHDRARWRTEQWCDRPWSLYQSGPIGSVYGRLKNVLGTYRLIEFKRKEYAVELEDVMNADLFVTSDLLFWQRVMQVVHNKVMIKLTKEQEDMLLSDWDEIPTVGVKKNGCQPWGGKKMLWYCMLYPKWNWWTQPKRQLWPPLPLTFLWPKSLGSLSKHWLGGTSWDPIYNSPSPTSPTRTRQNLPTPRCDQPIIGMENIMWGFNPSIWRQAWWISYSK